jgi:signal transduction histidine kinase
VLSAEKHGEIARIEIRDSGSGIAPEALPRIFDRFYRADPARTRKLGGTGLGLAIVRQIVHLHGGDVQIASEVGQGTVVAVSLPTR